ncbi:Membrane associated serine protease, rhomboid family [Ekhidna lutea]|uniref:Membrane associated serine protease, rhomboid family n=1 Tax=Ekhidna lutea TaxID=447679 RepID=A0A239GPW2_EKHLU|nr:rhomboid family intramembrane serine protease [Ekhidna lutea]SNS71177.1 Membrane associated serine protease, rhomboid family [Ekhidna lutea]
MYKSGLVPPLRLCFFMWLVFTIEFYLSVDLGYLGIYPREITGLVGVVMAPLLHGNFNHLVSNSIPLLVLGGSLFFFFPAIAHRVFLQAYFFTNILVWVFGRPFFHIGASGLIYALASFLVFYGLFKRNFKSVIVSAIVIFLYGGMAYSLLSFDDRISWESHLMGAVVGLVTAMLLRNK